MLRNYDQHNIYPTCRACGHEGASLSVFALILRLGPDYEMRRVIQSLRCAACGSRDVAVIFSPDARWCGMAETGMWDFGWDRKGRAWPVVRASP